MQWLDLQTTQGWIARHDLRFAAESSANNDRTPIRFIVPQVSKILWITRSVCSLFEQTSDRVLFISETGIWESSENWYLYYRLRASYGDVDTLDEIPGHLFSPSEFADMVSFVYLVILFGWQATLHSETDEVRVEISHDEVISVSFLKSDRREQFRQCLLDGQVNIMR